MDLGPNALTTDGKNRDTLLICCQFRENSPRFLLIPFSSQRMFVSPTNPLIHPQLYILFFYFFYSWFWKQQNFYTYITYSLFFEVDGPRFVVT